jgi:hypothetical protein
MTFTDALQTYRERLKGDHSLKERSKTYREERNWKLLVSRIMICDTFLRPAVLNQAWIFRRSLAGSATKMAARWQ